MALPEEHLDQFIDSHGPPKMTTSASYNGSMNVSNTNSHCNSNEKKNNEDVFYQASPCQSEKDGSLFCRPSPAIIRNKLEFIMRDHNQHRESIEAKSPVSRITKNHFQLNLNMTFEDAWQLESPGSSETNEDERNSFSFAKKLFDENNEIKEEEEEEEEMDDDFGPGKLTFSFL